MNKTYKLFRTYCIIAVAILFLLLFAVGICTAKFQTDKTVFKATYTTARIFSSDDNVTINMGGKIVSFDPHTLKEIFEKAKAVLLIPINNLLEIVKVIKRSV